MINIALWEMDEIICSCVLAPLLAYLLFWVSKLVKEFARCIKHDNDNRRANDEHTN